MECFRFIQNQASILHYVNLISQLKLTMGEANKVDLILMHMLPRFIEYFMSNNPASTKVLTGKK